MLDLLKKYCSIPAVSGDEQALRNTIINDIKDFADEITVDPLGNLIVFKKGKNEAMRRVMLDAHMDEIGLIITSITEQGCLRFDTVGGIDNKVLLGKRVKIGNVCGVIGGCAVHLLGAADKDKVIPHDKLYIDIGAADRDEAKSLVNIGDTAVFDTDYDDLGEKIAARALDDRIGCAILVQMIKQPQEYDMYFTFTVQEEVGCRGAKTAAFSVSPDFALIVEATTAGDLDGVPDDKAVCRQGGGCAISFMDGGTLYDRELYNFIMNECKNNGIAIQPKTAVKGGNNAGAIHLTKSGVRVSALSLPCRYIHSQYCLAAKADAKSLYDAVCLAANRLAGGAV